MGDKHTDVKNDMTLPMLVMTPSDVRRLRRELAVLDDYLQQQALRTPGQPMERLPRTSRLLDEAAAVNELNLLGTAARHNLGSFLEAASRFAPVFHISFAVDPSSAFLLKIVAWFRQNIHPLTLLKVGLQPGIAAGCVVRTTNRYFDLSLRQSLQKHRNVLHDMLVDNASPEVSPPAAAVTTPANTSEVAA